MSDREDTAVPPPQEETAVEEQTAAEEVPAGENTQPEAEPATTTEETTEPAHEKPAEEEQQPVTDDAGNEEEKPAEEEKKEEDESTNEAVATETAEPDATEEPKEEPEAETEEDPLDNPDATTAREKELQDRIAKLREQIEERKKRHAEVLEEKASKEEHLEEIKSNTEQTQDRLETTTMNVQHLRQLEDRSRIVAGKLERCENFMERVANWVSGPFAEENASNQTAKKRALEVDILTSIQELQNKRASKIKELGNLNKKLSENKTHMRQQHQREPRQTHKGFSEILTPQAKDYERCSSPRRTRSEDDPETEMLQNACQGAAEELQVYEGRMRNAQAQRSELTLEMKTRKIQNERSQAELKSAIRQKELSTKHDQRKCNELETKNAAIISTLEVQIKSLKLLHYGPAGGPTSRMLEDK